MFACFNKLLYPFPLQNLIKSKVVVLHSTVENSLMRFSVNTILFSLLTIEEGSVYVDLQTSKQT